jgi:thiol-disulfide isomerase/thioredoxin
MYQDFFMKPGWNKREYLPGSKASTAALQNNLGRLPVVILAFLIAILIVQPVSGIVILEYFHQQGCVNCEKTDPLIDSLRAQYRDRVAVESIEIDDRAGVNLLVSYGVTEIPVVVINRNKVLSFNEISPEKLANEIRLAESGAYPVPEKGKVSLMVIIYPLCYFSSSWA